MVDFRDNTVRAVAERYPAMRRATRHDPAGASSGRVDLCRLALSGRAMLPHTRAMIAAAVFALASGKKVAGLYDYSAGQHRRIAAEARGGHLQGFDGDRSAKFGGTVPEICDVSQSTFFSIEMERDGAHGYDRSSASAWAAQVSAHIVQLFDHSEGVWHTFRMQVV